MHLQKCLIFGVHIIEMSDLFGDKDKRKYGLAWRRVHAGLLVVIRFAIMQARIAVGTVVATIFIVIMGAITATAII